jgi:hypothetical protein
MKLLTLPYFTPPNFSNLLFTTMILAGFIIVFGRTILSLYSRLYYCSIQSYESRLDTARSRHHLLHLRKVKTQKKHSQTSELSQSIDRQDPREQHHRRHRTHQYLCHRLNPENLRPPVGAVGREWIDI